MDPDPDPDPDPTPFFIDFQYAKNQKHADPAERIRIPNTVQKNSR
jgi:hypothetical protein